MKMKYVLPLVIFLALAIFLMVGLNRDPREVPSPLIGKPAPEFSLPRLDPAITPCAAASSYPRLDDPNKVVSKKDMLGQVWLLNVWSSWCGSCRQEHPTMVKVGKGGQKIVPIIGLDYKDKDADAMRFLRQGGDPYDFSIKDPTGEVGINFGVYGVPETFVIDKKGVIRYKQIGPITPEAWDKKIHPLINQLKAE